MIHQREHNVLKIRSLAISVAVIILLSTALVFIPTENSVKAQNTQIPPGWVKFNHHSHGEFDVHDENGTVVGTIDESTNYLSGYTGDTPEMIRAKFGENGVFVHSPHVNNFEPYKEHWESQKRWENEQWSTTTNFTMGEEFHINGRHVGLINITYFVSYSDYNDFPSFRENITSQGGVIIINHPQHTWTANPKRFLLPGYEFDALEIYNNRVEFVGSPLTIPQTDGRADYRDAVTQGRLLAVIGGSDAHNDDSGWQTYTVAEDPLGEKNLDAVVRAIKNRRTYAAAYRMSTYDRSFFIECNEMGQVIENRDITINVSPPSGNTYTVDLFKNNITSPIQTWSQTGDTSITYTIPDSDALENAAYTFEIYEGGSAQSSDAIIYSTAIWYQPEVEYNLSVEPGWNLVSFPLDLNSTTITDVLSSIQGDYNVVHWFDPIFRSWKIYPGDNFELTNEISFWIHMKYASTLNLVGRMPFYKRIPLYSTDDGWNMVGFPSNRNRTVADALYYLTGKYTAVQNYLTKDTQDHWKHYNVDKSNNDLQILKYGQGYWIRVNQDCELVVFN
jgi:hypothetical protein